MLTHETLPSLVAGQASAPARAAWRRLPSRSPPDLKSAEERWGAAALRVAQALRQRSPSVTRDDMMKAIREQVPSAPIGRRSLEVAINGWLAAGELAPFIRSKRSA